MGESNKCGVSKEQLKILLQNLHHDDELVGESGAQLDNIEDILSNLGISDKKTYYRDDLNKVLRAMRLNLEAQRNLDRLKKNTYKMTSTFEVNSIQLDLSESNEKKQKKSKNKIYKIRERKKSKRK